MKLTIAEAKGRIRFTVKDSENRTLASGNVADKAALDAILAEVMADIAYFCPTAR